MAAYTDYARDVVAGRIVSGDLMIKACERFLTFCERDDMYLDEDEVERCIRFIGQMKHFKGKSAGKNFILEPWQQFIIANLIGLKWKDSGFRVCRETYIQVARKALDIETPIPTPEGFKRMGDLSVGDYVIGSDGLPTMIIYTTPVFDGDCYEVSFDDGTSIVADADHEWMVKRHCKSKMYRTTTKEMSGDVLYMDRGRYSSNYRIPLVKPDCFDDDINVELYALGAWLGDGSTSKPEFTCCGEDVSMYDRLVDRFGRYRVRKAKSHDNTYVVIFSGDSGKNNSRLRHYLEDVGVLHEKHIPEFVYNLPPKDKVSFIRGLMDTDGHVDLKGRCEIVQKRADVAEGLVRLMRSVGFQPRIVDKVVYGKTYKRVYFVCTKENSLFTLERKMASMKERISTRNRYRSITSISKVESRKVRCITVEADDHLFLAGENYSVTSNCGKDAIASAIALYLLIADGEASPEIILAANSTEQAEIAFKYISTFAKGLDPKGKLMKYLRRSVSIPKTSGICKVVSSDAKRQDGLNVSAFILDEYHEARDRAMYDVLRSSQGMREQPLAIIITTAGFNLDGPCHDMYELSIEVLNCVKRMDNFFPFIFQMDVDDDWTDERVWPKCQPNMDVTVTKAYMREEQNKALNDSTALTGVKTKTFNIWCQSKVTWLPQEIIAANMRDIRIDDFVGKQCIIGVDLSSVSDFSSITAFIPPENTDGLYYFITWTFMPSDNINANPNRMLYEKFIEEGSMIRTPGNVVDYDFILARIGEINRVLPVTAIYLDKYNATSFQIQLTEAGYNVNEFSQSVGNYNACTKEFEKLSREGRAILSKSANVLWQFGNVFLKSDVNGNTKPSKESVSKKIDSVISITTSLGGYLKAPVCNDFELITI